MIAISDTDRQARQVVAEAEATLQASRLTSDTVQVLGHRGAPVAGIAENSVAAVTEALLLGADGVEVDVWLTEDGGLVCAHDLDAVADLSALATLPELLAAVEQAAGARIVVEAKPVA